MGGGAGGGDGGDVGGDSGGIGGSSIQHAPIGIFGGGGSGLRGRGRGGNPPQPLKMERQDSFSGWSQTDEDAFRERLGQRPRARPWLRLVAGGGFGLVCDLQSALDGLETCVRRMRPPGKG